MDLYDVVGYRRVEFTREKTKEKVDGYTLFLQRQPSDDRIIGVECFKLFISCEHFAYVPHVGDTVRLIYNRYGKVGSIETC